mmetsp:Transcript_20155/g.29636  ORF Transcript_20155/g.29636 Transcript_20155/m.29636 type:complete len:386 (-) Transcript_20155:505-1662(-)
MSKAEVNVRVAVVGLQRARVLKVCSILAASSDTIADFPEEPVSRQIHVEYIPCVATFDSYQNEGSEDVRYLAKVEHHLFDGVHGGTRITGFFDEAIGDKEGDVCTTGIAAFAIGCGIESDEDVNMISSFVEMISGHKSYIHNDTRWEVDQNVVEGTIIIDCIKPNEDFISMKEETAAYRDLSPSEKECVTENQTIGPGKMAKFATDLARMCVPRTKKVNAEEEDHHQEGKEDELKNEIQDPLSKLKTYDVNMNRFACKMCRTILFGECDLEDIPHSKGQHSFSSRKMKSAGNAKVCQSIFLAPGLEWMVSINDSAEGKLSCPKCNGKLGLYKWHGTQCSCGSWVTPAIQIHSSRVDLVPPENERHIQDPIALLSPLARLHVAGQR